MQGDGWTTETRKRKNKTPCREIGQRNQKETWDTHDKVFESVVSLND